MGWLSLMDRPSGASFCLLLTVLREAREVVSREESDQQIAALALGEPVCEPPNVRLKQRLQGAFGIFHPVHEGDAVVVPVGITIAVIVDMHDKRAGREHGSELGEGQ